MSDDIDELFEGQSKGGRARAASLSASERKAIAQSAALARWHGELPRATHEGELRIADVALQCAVLEDGRRVLSERGVLRALGIHYGGAQFKRGVVEGAEDSDGDAVRLPMFVAGVNLRSFIDNDLLVLLTFKHAGAI